MKEGMLSGAGWGGVKEWWKAYANDNNKDILSMFCVVVDSSEEMEA